jgi:hypothetical protein
VASPALCPANNYCPLGSYLPTKCPANKVSGAGAKTVLQCA